MKVCTEIRERRTRLHLSQSQLAIAAGFSEATISKAENKDATPPSDETVWAILEALNQLESNPKKLEKARKATPASEKRKKEAAAASSRKMYAVLGLDYGWKLIGVYNSKDGAESRAGRAIREGEYRDAFVFKETDW